MTLADQAAEHRMTGSKLLARGLLLPARDAFVEWLKLAQATRDSGQIIPPLNALTAVAYIRGDLEEATRYVEQALTLCDDPVVPELDKLRVHLNAINIYADMGRLAEAESVAAKAARLDPHLDDNLTRTYWLNVTKLHWRQHDWAAMRDSAEKAYELCTAADDQAAMAKALINRGIAHMELGAYRLAELELTGAHEMTSNVSLSFKSYSYAELGRLHFARGEYGEALEAGREALNVILTGIHGFDKEEVARVSRLFGSIFAKSGQRNLALKYLNRAAAYFSQLGQHAEWQRSTELIGQVLSEPVRPIRSQLQREIHQLDFVTAVLDLTDDLESIDPFLRGHSERTSALAVILGEEIGLPDVELITLSHAARLADVGMIAVDADLLHKEEPLTESELQRVGMHTTIGEEMLRPYGFSAAGLAAIRHHHEYYGGSGLPDGLSGEAIPLLARLIAVVDTYDALSSERPHRRALSHSAALGEMQRMAGHKLDPILVERFIKLHQL